MTHHETLAKNVPKANAPELPFRDFVNGWKSIEAKHIVETQGGGTRNHRIVKFLWPAIEILCAVQLPPDCGLESVIHLVLQQISS